MVLVPTLLVSNCSGRMHADRFRPQLALAGAPVLTTLLRYSGPLGQLILREGASVSVTVTSWLAVAVRPCTSVTVQVTIVVPDGNCVGALLTTFATPQLS